MKEAAGMRTITGAKYTKLRLMLKIVHGIIILDTKLERGEFIFVTDIGWNCRATYFNI